jgi:hypothetical protein
MKISGWTIYTKEKKFKTIAKVMNNTSLKPGVSETSVTVINQNGIISHVI